MTSPEPLRAAICARVSTLDQEPENQLAELRKPTYRLGAGLLTSTPTRASVAPRINALPWISWSVMPSAGSSMC